MVKYEFYKNTYNGSSISEEDWTTFCRRAHDQLNRYKRIYRINPRPDAMRCYLDGDVTIDAASIMAVDDGQGNVTVVAPQVVCEAMAVCAMADALAYFTAVQNGTGAVASASIGSVSVSYGNATNVDISPKGQAKELYRCASLYLEFYRGVG
jgi:hypothetical protein